MEEKEKIDPDSFEAAHVRAEERILKQCIRANTVPECVYNRFKVSDFHDPFMRSAYKIMRKLKDEGRKFNIRVVSTRGNLDIDDLTMIYNDAKAEGNLLDRFIDKMCEELNSCIKVLEYEKKITSDSEYEHLMKIKEKLRRDL